MANIEIVIQNGDTLYYPAVEGAVTWETARKGIPGKLSFHIVKDSIINFQEGNAVRMKKDGEPVFYGFVFTKKRSKSGIIEVVAYDQLRYLKNKDTICYSNMTAGAFIKKIGGDFRLNLGTIENTGFVIPSRIEENKTLFDMVQSAIDITLENNKELFVLYDDFGKLTLRNIGNMKLDVMIDASTAEDFDYTSSIDGETYNRIKLEFENKKTNKRDVFIAQDSNSINSWGVLQYFDTIKEDTIGKPKADALLSLYNRKSRELSVKNAFGDIRVRGGSMIICKLELGDIDVTKYMIVESAKHTFEESEHFMDLKVRGADFIG